MNARLCSSERVGQGARFAKYKGAIVVAIVLAVVAAAAFVVFNNVVLSWG